MFIIHLNNELTYFNLGIRAQIHISPFNLTSFNVFNIKDFKLNILTPIFSGNTERRRKLEIPEI